MRSGTIRVLRALIPAAVAVGVVCAGTAHPEARQDCEILSEDENHVTFTVRLSGYELKEVTVGGVTYSRIVTGDLTSIAGEGQPDIPAFAVMLAVPEGASVRLESFSRSDETVLEGVRVLPVARLEARGEDAGRFADNIYDEDRSVYGGVAPFPGSSVWVTDRGRLRHQDVARVFVSPFIYEPGRERLIVSSEMTVTVGFQGKPQRAAAPPADDRWEGVYHDVLLNYEQGRHWRARKAPTTLRSEVTNDRLKMLIETTGMHRLEFDNASAVGFPEGIAIDEIFIYRDEFREGTPDTLEVVESAIDIFDNDQDGFFSSGDGIVFYAKDLREQFGYRGNEDMFFDYNVYWLSWGPGEHRRMESRPGWREGSTPSRPEHFGDFLHMEKDIYFSNFPPLNAAYEEYDLFYWGRWKASFPFDLPGVHPDYPCSLIVNFISYYNEPSHLKTPRIHILVEGCTGVEEEIDERTIFVPSHVRITYGIEAGFFCDVDNVFRIRSETDQNWTPGHTVDWFEIFYERRFEAYEDNLAFTNAGMTGELEFEITDFSTSDITLYDISDPVVPVKLDVSPENIVPDGGAFNITFRDSVGGDKHYFSASPPGLVEIGADQLSLVDPPALRNVAAGYIAISHPDFVAALSPLIAERREQGHTAVVATTEEVYDDFGNGMKSDVAIRRFIKQGFFAGGTEFVLLVGDANIDRKGYLNEQQPGQARSDVDYVPSHNMIMSDGFTPGNLEIRPNDNWFVMVDGPDDEYPDLYIGRLSVGSPGQAAAVVGKILDFENDPGEDAWKKRMVLIADDEFGDNKAGYPTYLDCYTGQSQFKSACETAAVMASSAVVPLDTVKCYLERCTEDDQPDKRCRQVITACCTNWNITRPFARANCTPEVLSTLNAGALMVNFQGHANRWQFTHEEVIYDYRSPEDVQGLHNSNKPFIFFGFGCWINDFQWLAEPVVGDAIGEKFVLNPGGGACASFATGCADPINQNETFNGFVTRAFFADLQGKDPHGNDIPARMLLGEALMTALLRYGNLHYIDTHILLGDPAMVVDMGPPAITVSVDGSVIDESYVFEGETFDTLEAVSEIKDEEAITSIALEIVEDGATVAVPPDAYSEVALVDSGLARSRSYRVTYDHVPVLGDYVVRITGTDYAAKVSSFDIQIATGSAGFFVDQEELAEGGQVVFGQHLKVLLNRPRAFEEDDIEVRVDTIAAEGFEDYSIEVKDGEGKQWQVSFIPSLAPGGHDLSVSVEGFKTGRRFEYIPAHFEFLVNGKPLYNGDYVSPRAEFAVLLKAEASITGDDVGADLDGEPVEFAFAPDSSGWRLTFDRDLDPGDHELSVTLFGVPVTRTFAVSNVLMLTDVSAYPNPFSGEVYFFYTLSQDVREVGLSVFTVSGRLIRETAMTPFVGYNEFMWDGRDDRGDRVANGTYLYRVVARAGSGEREFTGWVVKVE